MVDKDTGKELTVTDLIPETAELTLKGKTYNFKKYSLLAKTHFIKKYGVEELVKQLSSNCAEIVYSEIAYYLIDAEGKKDFPTFDSFQEAFTSPQEQLDMVDAIKITMGQSKITFMTESEHENFMKEKKTKK